MEEAELAGDPKYRAYAAGVEKALRAFETTSEWADLISALERLLKVLHNNAKFGDVPKAVLVAKRVSQCLHPNLPSGVHIKAIKVLDQIFTVLGPEGTVRVLDVFSVGMFPLVGQAQIKVKTELMRVFEDHLLPLGVHLRPPLVAVLASLLPAYEESSKEFFERTGKLLRGICSCVGPVEFYTGLWHCVLTNPPVRLPALLFLNHVFDSAKPIDDQIHVVGANLDFMVSALCAAASDEQLLTQRSLLHFLSSAFPLHSSHIVPEDGIRLVDSCIFVLLRREMTLNKRLYSWLLGATSNPGETVDLAYFRKHSLPLINAAIRKTLANPNSAIEKVVRLCRVLVYFLDRPEVGEAILDEALPPLLNFLAAQETQNSEAQKAKRRRRPQPNRRRSQPLKESLVVSDELQELEKGLNLLLNALEPCFIWDSLGREANSDSSPLSLCAVATVTRAFLRFRQLDSHADLRSDVLPGLLRRFLQVLLGPRRASVDESRAVLAVAADLLREVQLAPAALSSEPGDQAEELAALRSQALVDDCLKDFLAVVESVFAAFRDDPVAQWPIVLATCDLMSEFLTFPRYSVTLEEVVENTSEMPRWLELLCETSFVPWRKELAKESCFFKRRGEVVETLVELMVSCGSIAEQRVAAASAAHPFNTFRVFLEPLLSPGQLRLLRASPFLRRAAACLWESLDDATAEESSARLIWLIHAVDDDAVSSAMEDVILADLTHTHPTRKYVAAERFWKAWSMSRSLNNEELLPGLPLKPFHRVVMLMLGAAGESGSAAAGGGWKSVAGAWFRDSLRHSDASRLLHVLFLFLYSPSTARISVQYLDAWDHVTDSGVMLSTMDLPSTCRLYHMRNMPTADKWTEDDARRVSEVGREVMQEEEVHLSPIKMPSNSNSPLKPSVSVRRQLDFHSFDDALGREEDSTVVASIVGRLVDDVVEEAEAEATLRVHEALAVAPVQDHFAAGPYPGKGSPVEMATDATLGVESSPEQNDTWSDGEEAFAPTHAHFLLYSHPACASPKGTGLAESEFAFATLRGLLRLPGGVGSELTGALASTGVGGLGSGRGVGRLGDWVTAQLRQILGKGGGEEEAAEERTTRNWTLLELLLNACLHHLRSFLLNSPNAPATAANLAQNWRTKTQSLECLATLLDLLSQSVDERGSSLANYISDLLQKSKLQKCLLHSLMVSVQVFPRRNVPSSWTSSPSSLSRDILDFNLCGCESATEFVGYESAQLRAALGLLRLERRLSGREAGLAESRLFLVTLLKALGVERAAVSGLWLAFVAAALEFVGASLGSICVHVTEQLGQNIHFTMRVAFDEATEGGAELPVGYLCRLLACLGQIWHHCLLSLPNAAPTLAPAAIDSSTRKSKSGGLTPVDGLRNIGSMFKVFGLTDSPVRPRTIAVTDSTATWANTAREEVLSSLPHVFSTICSLWSRIKEEGDPRLPVGSAQSVRRLILDLLGPLAVYFPSQFLSALAMVWLARQPPPPPPEARYALGEPTEAQADIAELVLSLKVFPLENVISSVCACLRDAAAGGRKAAGRFPVELCLMELVSATLSQVPLPMLRGAWSPLYKLLSLVAAPGFEAAVVFRAFGILVHYVRLCCSGDADGEERKPLKELEELTKALIEALNVVVSQRLVQATWLKRTLVFRHTSPRQSPGEETDSKALEGSSLSVNSSGSGSAETSKETNDSTQALFILAHEMASVVDGVWRGDEKEKLTPLLTSVWNNMHPFLKARQSGNGDNIEAVSLWLANVSNYSWTRSVWKRPTIEIFLDTVFFRQPLRALRHWMTIIDNTMTQDKTSFKELLSRMSGSSGAAGGLFTSREAEAEMRAGGVKRLGWAILASQSSQWQSAFPEIREKLTELLRLWSGAEAVEASVLLVFRVLLVRIQPTQLAALWPLLLSQVVLVLSRMEALLTEAKAARTPLHVDEATRDLFLSAAKLLGDLFRLPPAHLAQFQMYSWGFARLLPDSPCNGMESIFVPHADRLSKLFAVRRSRSGNKGHKGGDADVAGLRDIASVWELKPFFDRLAEPTYYNTQNQSLDDAVKAIEESLICDFVEDYE